MKTWPIQRWTRCLLTAGVVGGCVLLASESSNAQGGGPGDCAEGLRGEYFGDRELGLSVLSRTDPTVDFDWGNGSPDASVPRDDFSARWTGSVEPRFSEPYTFYTHSDDGVRLWVDGRQLVDNWTGHPETENAGTIVLTTGRQYSVKMEFFEWGSRALARLLWSSPSQAKEVVPASRLRPALCAVGVRGEYFGDRELGSSVLTRTDPTVDFDWGNGSPDPSVPRDNFSVRWTGSVEPRFSEQYTFYTRSDDGVRLWVDGRPLIDNWTGHPETENAGTIALTAGRQYPLKMEFFEWGSRALARLLWSSPSQAKEIIPASQLRPFPVEPPEPLGTTYYVDYAGGNDANDGRSPTTAFQHSPGDPEAQGQAASTTLAAGDVVAFKRGVTYRGTVRALASGAVVAQGSKGSVTAAGLLTDTAAQFITRGVRTAHYVYIYHSKESQDDTWVESTGLFAVRSVRSPTALELEGFHGAAHETAEMTYVVLNPITYTSLSSWGSGDAVFDGEGTRPVLLDIDGQAVIRVQSLRFVNTAAGEHRAAIFDGGNYVEVVGCAFANMATHGVGWMPDFAVVSGNEFRRFGYAAFPGGDRNSLVEHNTIIGPGTRCFSGGRFAVLRYNYCKDMVGGGGSGGAHPDGIGFIDGGPRGDQHYGWIYGNTVDNTIVFIAMYETGGGTRNWTIHSNVLIGHYPLTPYGAQGLSVQGAYGMRIYNNVFFGVPGSRGIIQPLHIGSGSQGIDVRNNIFYSSTRSQSVVVAEDSTGGVAFDNNHYYSDSPFCWNNSGDFCERPTLAQWRAMGFDVHGIPDGATDPRFVSLTTPDLHLRSDSPDVDRGADLSQAFRVDFDGNLRPQGAGYDLGAFEFPQGGTTPSVSIDDVSLTEENSGTGDAVFTATLSAASAGSVTVSYATADGTATAGSDYVSTSGSLTFPPGTTTRTIAVPVRGDTLVEADETFFVDLSNPSGATIGDGRGQASITDDDALLPTLSIGDLTVAEGNSGTTEAVFTVSLSAPSSQPVSASYSTANGTATSGSDYAATAGSLSFPPGTLTRTLAVSVNGDTTVEPDETFFVNLSSPSGATLADAQGQATITNDDTSTSARNYYVDYAGGNDVNDGRSPTTAFQHSPGDPEAQGQAASTTLAAGDVVAFKRGVTYRGTVRALASGAVVAQGSKGSVTAAGLLTDTAAQFITRGVRTTDYVYIYHSKESQDDTWVESTGLFAVRSVPSQTALELEGFHGAAHETAEMTYVVLNPITYTSLSSWGSGDAVFDGQGSRPVLLDLNGQDVIRVEALRFVDTQRVDGQAAIYSRGGGADYLQVIGCSFENMGMHGINVGGLPDTSDYVVTAHNRIRNFGYVGIAGPGRSVLTEHNEVIGPGVRCFWGGRFAVLRFNYCKDMNGTSATTGHADGIGFIDGGANGDQHYGWIYGNTVDNTVVFIAMYGTGGGTHYWTIHSNLLIGRYGITQYGAEGLSVKNALGLRAYNNTFFAVPGSPGFIAAMFIQNGSRGIVVRNNIFYSTETPRPLWVTPDSASGLVIDNNHYYTRHPTPFCPNYSFTTGCPNVSFDQWRTMGFDRNSIPNLTTDPRFVSPGRLDAHLRPDSPDIDRGTDLSISFTTDAAGNQRPYGPGFDMGAFEFRP